MWIECGMITPKIFNQIKKGSKKSNYLITQQVQHTQKISLLQKLFQS